MVFPGPIINPAQLHSLNNCVIFPPLRFQQAFKHNKWVWTRLLLKVAFKVQYTFLSINAFPGNRTHDLGVVSAKRSTVWATCDAVYKWTKKKCPSTMKVVYLMERSSCREYGYDALKCFLCRLTRFRRVQWISLLLKKQKPGSNPLTK